MPDTSIIGTVRAEIDGNQMLLGALKWLPHGRGPPAPSAENKIQ
jgi:hypothetical protein